MTNVYFQLFFFFLQDPNTATKHGLTPLHKAAMNGNLHCAKLLVQNGAQVNIADVAGNWIIKLMYWDQIWLMEMGLKVIVLYHCLLIMTQMKIQTKYCFLGQDLNKCIIHNKFPIFIHLWIVSCSSCIRKKYNWFKTMIWKRKIKILGTWFIMFTR